MKPAILGFACLLISQAAQSNVEIDNESARVIRLVSSARETTPARNLPPALLIFLADYHVRIVHAGGATAELRGKAGEFHWDPGGETAVENVQDRRTEWIRVEPKPGANSVEPSAAPKNLVFENEQVVVIRVRHEPRKQLPTNFANASVAIFLTDAHMKQTYAEGKVQELKAKAGDVQWMYSGTWVAENLTGHVVDGLRIRIKAGRKGDGK